MKIPLKQKAYNYILDRIVSGELKPGERMSEVAMAREIGISPTPLREAYRQLASEGFVTHVPNAGIFVRELTKQEIAELYEMREALEAYAAGKAALLMNSVILGELKECLKIQHDIGKKLKKSGKTVLLAKQEADYMKADAKFHVLILNAADNQVIMKTMRESHVIRNLLRFRSHEHSLKQIKNTLEQHDHIFKAIEEHKPEKAEKWMRKHIQFSAATALENWQAEENNGLDDAGQELNRFIYNIESQ